MLTPNKGLTSETHSFHKKQKSKRSNQARRENWQNTTVSRYIHSPRLSELSRIASSRLIYGGLWPTCPSIHPQFFSIWKCEPNQILNILTRPAVHQPTTLLAGINLCSYMPWYRFTDFSWLIFASTNVSYPLRAMPITLIFLIFLVISYPYADIILTHPSSRRARLSVSGSHNSD